MAFDVEEVLDIINGNRRTREVVPCRPCVACVRQRRQEWEWGSAGAGLSCFGCTGVRVVVSCCVSRQEVGSTGLRLETA